MLTEYSKSRFTTTIIILNAKQFEQYPIGKKTLHIVYLHYLTWTMDTCCVSNEINHFLTMIVRDNSSRSPYNDYLPPHDALWTFEIPQNFILLSDI